MCKQMFKKISCLWSKGRFAGFLSMWGFIKFKDESR